MVQYATDQPQSDPCDQVVDAPQLETMLQDVFQSLLNEGINLHDDCLSAEDEWLQATIRITGDKSCTIRMISDQPMAEFVASRMFDQEVASLEEDEINDALSELVNVIGGNIKGAINLECQLSLPCIGVPEEGRPADGSTYSFSSGGRKLAVVIN